MKKYERKFEQFLWQCRHLVLFAVVSSLLGAFVLFIIGSLDILNLVLVSIQYYLGLSPVKLHDIIVKDVIIAIDIFLIALVLMIFGLGIYRLFISPIDEAEDQGQTHPLNVKSFDELKDKIVRVVILAVIIEFFRAVVDIHFDTPLAAIYLALSVLALAISLFLMSWHQKK